MNIFALAVFFCLTNQVLSVSEVTPDLLVACIALLASAAVCRIYSTEGRPATCLTLGLILAIGYYAKAAMFPIGIFLVAILFIRPPNYPAARLWVLSAGIVFVLASSPLVFMVSSRVGHLSFGEAGRLNYLWYVNRVPSTGWRGNVPGTGAPTHRLQVLRTQPLAIGFRAARQGTYSPWYDPAYWYDGARLRLDSRQIMTNLLINLRAYSALALDLMPLLVGIIVLSAAFRRSIVVGYERVTLVLLLWIFSVFTMYAVVHVEPRFFVAFLVVASVLIYDVLVRPPAHHVAPFILATVALGLTLPVLARAVVSEPRVDHQGLAAGMRALGIKPGDELAVLGRGFDTYYVRLSGARVVAQVPDDTGFYASQPDELVALKADLLHYGVKALVTPNLPQGLRQSAWKSVTTTGGARLAILPTRD